MSNGQDTKIPINLLSGGTYPLDFNSSSHSFSKNLHLTKFTEEILRKSNLIGVNGDRKRSPKCHNLCNIGCYTIVWMTITHFFSYRKNGLKCQCLITAIFIKLERSWKPYLTIALKKKKDCHKDMST